MNLTNVALVATSLLTNTQSSLTGYTTNGLAIITHVEQVQRVETITWQPRRWSELLPVTTQQPARQPESQQPVSPALSQAKPAVSNPVLPGTALVTPGALRTIPPIGEGATFTLNTNSPAFRHRAEREARRRRVAPGQTSTNQPAFK